MSKRFIDYPAFVNKEGITVENYGYDDEKFRFLLKVPFKTSGGNFLRVIMKNPSKADLAQCDMTMLKVCNAAHRASYDGVIVMNLFPYRATKAADLYEKFCAPGGELYEEAMAKNREIIKANSQEASVVFAWGTNTINGKADFTLLYDNLAEEIKGTVISCAERAESIHKNNSKYPLHALRWHYDILVEGSFSEVVHDKKHMVIHRNMFGPSAEVANCNPKDLEIFCYKRNSICNPDCTDCKYLHNSEMGQGIACEWEDFDGNISTDERVIQNHEKFLEYDRAQLVKKFFCKKDVDHFMELCINYEK